MPQVPRYNQPTIDQRPLPNVKAPTDTPVEAFGGGRSLERVGAAGRNLAQTGLDIVEAEKKKADEIAIRDADISAAELSNQIESGVKQLRGKDAAAAPDFVKENWTKGVEKILPTLNTDNQRIAADRIIRQRRSELEKETQLHMSNEFTKYDAERNKAAVELYRNDGVMKYNEPGSVDKAIFQQESEIDRYAARNNMPDEWRDLAKEKAVSETHTDVINRMLDDKKPFMALDYFNKNKDAILSNEHKRITDAIDTDTLDAKAQANASRIILSTVTSKTGGVSFDIAKATGKVDDISDKKLREETRKQVDLQIRTMESLFDKTEAAGSGLIANNQMTQTWLDQNKNNITDSYYRAASYAMKNYGKPTASDAVKNSTMVSLLDQYTKIMDGDIYARTQKLMGYRTNVLASVSKLDPDAFNKLLSYSDPNFVPTPEKEGFFKAAIKWIGENARRVGTEAGPAIMQFIDKAAKAKPEDIPAIAQNSVRGPIYDKNPSLVGKADLSNNIVNQTKGPRQVYDGSTKLKPDQTLKPAEKDPIDVQSEAEAFKYPDGTRVKLNGKIFKVKK